MELLGGRRGQSAHVVRQHERFDGLFPAEENQRVDVAGWLLGKQSVENHGGAKLEIREHLADRCPCYAL